MQIFKNTRLPQAPLVPWGVSDRAFIIVLIVFMTLLGFVFVYDLTGDTSNPGAGSKSIWVLMTSGGLVYGILLTVAFVLGPFKHRVHISMLGFNSGSMAPWNVRANGFIFQLRLILVALSTLILINILWTLFIDMLSWDLLSSPEYPFMDYTSGGLYLLLTGFLVVILGPFAEEVFFRGYILPGLSHKVGTGGSLIISSMIFSLAHMTLSLLIHTFFMGLVLGLLYLRTKSVLSCTVAHGIQNGMALTAMVLVGG